MFCQRKHLQSKADHGQGCLVACCRLSIAASQISATHRQANLRCCVILHAPTHRKNDGCSRKLNSLKDVVLHPYHSSWAWSIPLRACQILFASSVCCIFVFCAFSSSSLHDMNQRDSLFEGMFCCVVSLYF
jgi:hypothetical protein